MTCPGHKEFQDKDLRIIAAFADEGAYQLPLDKLMCKGDPEKVLRFVCESMPDEILEGLHEMWYVVEGFAIPPSLDEKRPLEVDLQEDFERNPASDVQRALHCIVASDDLVGGCDMQGAVLPYVITDGGLVAWLGTLTDIDYDINKAADAETDPFAEIFTRLFERKASL